MASENTMKQAPVTLMVTGANSDLKRQFRKANRRRRLTALLLLAPLLLFTLIFFATPIAGLLTRAVHSPEYSEFFPNSATLLRSGSSFDEAFFRALFGDIRNSDESRTAGKVARRLNQDQTGFISLIKKTTRAIRKIEKPEVTYKTWFIELDKRWGEPPFQQAMKRAASPVTDFYLLATLDLNRDLNGSVSRAPDDRTLFLEVFVRTIWISLLVTVICVVLGYPVAWVLANTSPGWRNIMLVGVLFPFWTSLLVRTAAWIIVLQKEGPINSALRWLEIIDAPLQLAFNRFGVCVALTHILLPFLILPLYSVMVGIPKDYMRAAKSLGARPVKAFFSVYVPLTLPGLSAGAILVFILAIGYYITPALIGGPRDQMISYFIAFYTNNTINWGLASALALNLLLVTIVLYGLYQRIVGVGRVGMEA